MSDISAWSDTAASNNSVSPDGFPENMAPSGVNDAAREVMAAVRRWFEDAQWTDLGDTPTYVSASSFTIATDVTATYAANRRLKLYGTTMGTLYGTISSSSYSAPNTTVNVTLDSGSLTNNLSAVYVGILTATNLSIPVKAFLGTATFNSSGSMTAGSVPRARLAITEDHGTKSANYELDISTADMHLVTFSATATLTISSANTNDKAIVVVKNGGNAITLAGIDNDAPTLTNAASKQDFLGIVKSFGKISCVSSVLNRATV